MAPRASAAERRRPSGRQRDFRRLGGERSEDCAAPLEPGLTRGEVADPVFDRVLIGAPPVGLRVGQWARVAAPILARPLRRRLGEGAAGRAGAKGEIGGAGEAEGERQRRERDQHPQGGGPEPAVRIELPREIDRK